MPRVFAGAWQGRFTGQARPAFCGLRSRRCQDILCSKILLHGVLDKRAANAALLQLPAQALRPVATAGEARGEIGVRIGRIVEGTAGLEACNDLLRHLVRHPAPAQLLPDLVNCTWTGGQVLQRGCLGYQELLSGCQAHLVCHAQSTPYPQSPLAHEFLGDAEGKRPVQKDRHTGRLVLLHRQGRDGAGLHTCIEMMFHARALLIPALALSTVRMGSIAEAQEPCRGPHSGRSKSRIPLLPTQTYTDTISRSTPPRHGL
jgi:hypothetical protein